MEKDNFKTIEITMLMTPAFANFSGAVHGGHLLKILDEVAYACAARYCGHYAVTLSVDNVIFRQPIAVGSLVHFLASVNYTGKTSMEIGIKVVAENLQERYSIHTNTAFLTMVARKDGKSCPIPQLQPETQDEKRRFERAKQRRSSRH